MGSKCIYELSIRPRSNVLNISRNNTEHLLSATCSMRLTTLLSRVHPCWVLFSEVWSWSKFWLNKCWATQHFLCFSRCWELFSAFDQSLNICSVRACAVGNSERDVQPCSAKCSADWTSLNNTQLCWTNAQCCLCFEISLTTFVYLGSLQGINARAKFGFLMKELNKSIVSKFSKSVLDIRTRFVVTVEPETKWMPNSNSALKLCLNAKFWVNTTCQTIFTAVWKFPSSEIFIWLLHIKINLGKKFPPDLSSYGKSISYVLEESDDFK